MAYKPALFQHNDDLLLFPGKDFNKWHSEIVEYIDGIYQINSKTMEKERRITISDLNLLMGILSGISYELENLFDPDSKMDFGYHYISTLDEKYKKRRPTIYGKYMHKTNRKAVVVTPQMKYEHIMEIVDYAYCKWRNKKIKKNKILQSD